MREWCMDVVSFFGGSWGWIGWGLFLLWFLGPYLVPSIVFWLLTGLLLVLWWILDAVDQEIA
ncbi:MAG: hypothetical protein HPY54_14455 [Chthonomonadetes bacterium]|nr:hypothetical protein [Chthonomonadetes bacterium]